MDRLQFNNWHLDGWLHNISATYISVGNNYTDMVFEIIEGDLTNGDERIWFMPDPQGRIRTEEFQGSVESMNLNVERQTNQIQTLGEWGGEVIQNWGSPRRMLNLRILDVVESNDLRFNREFVNRNYPHYVNATRPQRSNWRQDPDMEKNLVQQQIERECKLAREQQEQIDYEKFPNRLDSID